MKAFVKLQCAILDRFPDWQIRGMAEDLLKLTDREGWIEGDYDAIAARTRRPVDDVIRLMGELQKPDPNSKCRKYQGAFVVRAGVRFLIPAVPRHRKRNADTEARRAYRRDWQRKKRPSRAKNWGEQGRTRGEQGRTRGELPPPSKENKGEHGENKGEHGENCERDREYRDKKIVESTVVPTLSGNTVVPHQDSSNSKSQESVIVPRKKKPGPDNFGYTPQGGSGVDYYALPDLIENPHLAMAVICADIYQDALRPNQVAQDSWQKLVQLLPISKDQIQEIGFYVHLNLEPKQRPGIRYLIDNWADFASRAAAAMQ